MEDIESRHRRLVDHLMVAYTAAARALSRREPDVGLYLPPFVNGVMVRIEPVRAHMATSAAAAARVIVLTDWPEQTRVLWKEALHQWVGAQRLIHFLGRHPDPVTAAAAESVLDTAMVLIAALSMDADVRPF